MKRKITAGWIEEVDSHISISLIVEPEPEPEPDPPPPLEGKTLFHFLAGEISPTQEQLDHVKLGTATEFAGGLFENATAHPKSTCELAAGNLRCYREPGSWRQHQLRPNHPTWALGHRNLMIGVQYRFDIEFLPNEMDSLSRNAFSCPLEFWGPYEGFTPGHSNPAWALRVLRGNWECDLDVGDREATEVRDVQRKEYIGGWQRWTIDYLPHDTSGFIRVHSDHSGEHQSFAGCTVLTTKNAERTGPLVQVGHYSGAHGNGFTYREIRISEQ